MKSPTLVLLATSAGFFFCLIEPATPLRKYADQRRSFYFYDQPRFAYELRGIYFLKETMNMADNQSRGIGSLNVKVNVDVSEALTGLKALQREAKKATQVLKELEAAQRNAGKYILPPLQTHPNTPFVAPLTVGEVPDHVKDYGKHDFTYVSTGTKTQAWFKDGEADE
jgi:hypothetical protein